MENKSNEYTLDFCEKKLIPLIRNIAERRLSSSYQIERKSHGNFVTTADKEIEQDLKTGLHALAPAAGFIAEESGEDSHTGYNWVIDPIDGTTNFIYGLPFAISVALTSGNIDNVILGVVYNPRDNVIYYACKDSGSFAIKNGIKRQLHVGSFEANEGIAVFGMPYNREKTEKIFAVAEQIYSHASDLKRIGPAALDICMVAEGKAKIYFELDLNVWDICAGKLVLTEAGGNCRQEGDLFLFGNETVWDCYPGGGLL